MLIVRIYLPLLELRNSKSSPPIIVKGGKKFIAVSFKLQKAFSVFGLKE